MLKQKNALFEIHFCTSAQNIVNMRLPIRDDHFQTFLRLICLLCLLLTSSLENLAVSFLPTMKIFHLGHIEFSQKANLTKHVESVHEGRKPFKCSNCDGSFTEKGSLNRHIKSIHEQKRENCTIRQSTQMCDC